MNIPSLQNIIIMLPGLLIALAFHEYAHGLVADYLGDDTPAYQGRLTINPLVHIDWIGFFMLMLAGFGWAKPVQVNPLNFKGVDMRKGMMMVSLAGPAMNFLLAGVTAVAMKLVYALPLTTNTSIILSILQPLLIFNIVLGIFNLLPVPPLDGSKILAGLLPDDKVYWIDSMERYGIIILLVLVFSGAISWILGPLLNAVIGLLNVFIMG
ncbi:MAG: site-2 protease family protein [Syntrophomonadaceae bacterium]|nr:site-2 protease family protein [Syntrophomonadaceae bacterium]